MDKPFGPEDLGIDTSYYNKLDIRSFMLMLKDPSYADYLQTEESKINIAVFDKILSSHKGISDVKKIDCLLWSMRN